MSEIEAALKSDGVKVLRLLLIQDWNPVIGFAGVFSSIS